MSSTLTYLPGCNYPIMERELTGQQCNHLQISHQFLLQKKHTIKVGYIASTLPNFMLTKLPQINFQHKLFSGGPESQLCAMKSEFF